MCLLRVILCVDNRLLHVISTSDIEASPPLPPSRSASIRPEASPPTGNPPRPPRPRPQPRQTPRNDTTADTSTTNQGNESSTTVAALRQAVFGEKRSAHPPAVLQKSITKAVPRKQEQVTDPSAEIKEKVSVLKLAAVLEATKRSSTENSVIESTVKESTPADSREHHLQGRSSYQSTAPTTIARQTQSRNINKLSTLNQQSEGSMHPSGAPYEVPQQGSKHQPSSVSASKVHTSNTSSERDRIIQTQPQNQIQSSLSTSLQAALAKRTLNREQGATSHEEIQLSSLVNNPPQQAESTLLERIRQRKAARANVSAPVDDSSCGISQDPTSRSPESTQNTFSNQTANSNRAIKDQINIKPPLPDPSTGNSGRGSHKSSLRRSSSNVSANRISSESPHDAGQKQNRQLHRSPTSVAQLLKDTNISDRADSHIHASDKGLQRTPSSCSRRSDDESIPQLPPRSSIQADADLKSVNQTQSQFTGKQVLPKRNSSDADLSTTPAKRKSEDLNFNGSSSYAEGSMVFADFISKCSGALPLAVSIQNTESVSSQRLVATRQCSNFNIHFIKHSKVVIIHDNYGGECFSVPLNSSVKFGLIYDQPSDSNTDHTTYFETAGEIMNLKQLPYIICATKQYDGGALEKSVAAGEILFVRGIKRAKAIGRGKCLKVNSIDGDEKLLGSRCCGGFTTAPHECQLNLLVMMQHSIPLPQQAMLFSNTEILSYLPQNMIDNPVTLDRIQGETSAIMTPRDVDEVESWMYDVSTEMKLWVKKVPLSAEEQEDLNAETNVFYTTFDPLYTQHYAEKSDDNGIALQHVLTVNVMPGKEKEGVHLYLPSTNISAETSRLLADINADLSRGRTGILDNPDETMNDETEHNATYALHITEQRSMKASKRSADKLEVISIASANTEHSEGSSYIPPTEDSDPEQEFDDNDHEPEEAYEEVMSGTVNTQEDSSDPEPIRPRKLVDMFKSVKQSLTKTSKVMADTNVTSERASSSPEPEDYDQISFTEDIPADEGNMSGPPPLPDTNQIVGRKPPQMAPPPPPFQQIATTSIALQRLMAAAKISSASVNESEQDKDQEEYQPVRADDEMFEDEESGYSDVRSLDLDIPSLIAAKKTSIAAMLGKRKPPLPLPSKEESPEPVSHKHTLSSQTPDRAELAAQNIQQSSSRHSSSGGSTEGDYLKLRSLYSGLQTQVSQLMDEVSLMKTSIEQLSQMVDELIQAKDNKQDSVHPSNTKTLPRRKKSIKVK